MRRINQLSKSELITYSKVIISIHDAISNDLNIRKEIMSKEIKKPRYLNFYLSLDQYVMFEVTFDREKRNFCYNDILIPDGIFNEAIYFEPVRFNSIHALSK